MNRQAFLIFFLAHILGDFYFQSNKTVDEKRKNIYGVIRHCVHCLITYVILTALLMQPSPGLLSAVSLLAVSHFFIDLLKMKLARGKFLCDGWIFFVDQILHIASIAVIVLCLFRNGLFENSISGFLNKNVFTGFKFNLITAVTAFLLIVRPARFTVQYILDIFGISSEGKTEGYENSSLLIGYTERALALALVLAGQYSAISWLIAAKGLARFNETNDKKFSEYFIIGTLLSFICVGAASLTLIVIK
jgi:hypothetical protein